VTYLQNLLDDLGYDTSANGSAAFADSEAEVLLNGDGLNELNGHINVVTRHYHLYAFGQVNGTGYVGRTEVELRAYDGRLLLS